MTAISFRVGNKNAIKDLEPQIISYFVLYFAGIDDTDLDGRDMDGDSHEDFTKKKK